MSEANQETESVFDEEVLPIQSSVEPREPPVQSDPEPVPPDVRFEMGHLKDLLDHMKAWIEWRLRRN